MLSFTRGLSQTDEPDLWRQDLTGAVKQWIETGLPDERRILKACGRADEVAVYAYGRNADVWWAGVKGKLARTRNLAAYVLPADPTPALAGLAARRLAQPGRAPCRARGCPSVQTSAVAAPS